MSVLVSVCICTFQRTHVRETVQSVLGQEGCEEIPFEIVVVDDDPERSAEAIVGEIASNAIAAIRYVVSGAQNIAAARNVCLAEAAAPWIAFIDDDEVAAPDWLARLLEVADQYRADVVKGAVIARYPAGASDWILRADPFSRDYGADGETPRRLASGNVLLRRELAMSANTQFDTAFGAGGEDSEFFHRLLQLNPEARVAAARSARVYEIVQQDRVQVDYLARRFREQGRVSGMRLALGTHERPAWFAGLEARAALACLWWHPLLRDVHGPLALRLMIKHCHSAGLLEAMTTARPSGALPASD